MKKFWKLLICACLLVFIIGVSGKLALAENFNDEVFDPEKKSYFDFVDKNGNRIENGYAELRDKRGNLLAKWDVKTGDAKYIKDKLIVGKDTFKVFRPFFYHVPDSYIYYVESGWGNPLNGPYLEDNMLKNPVNLEMNTNYVEIVQKIFDTGIVDLKDSMTTKAGTINIFTQEDLIESNDRREITIKTVNTEKKTLNKKGFQSFNLGEIGENGVTLQLQDKGIFYTNNTNVEYHKPIVRRYIEADDPSLKREKFVKVRMHITKLPTFQSSYLEDDYLGNYKIADKNGIIEKRVRSSNYLKFDLRKDEIITKLEDKEYKTRSLIVISSGNMINIVRPDENGYIEFYENRDISKYDGIIKRMDKKTYDARFTIGELEEMKSSFSFCTFLFGYEDLATGENFSNIDITEVSHKIAKDSQALMKIRRKYEFNKEGDWTYYTTAVIGLDEGQYLLNYFSDSGLARRLDVNVDNAYLGREYVLNLDEAKNLMGWVYNDGHWYYYENGKKLVNTWKFLPSKDIDKTTKKAYKYFDAEGRNIEKMYVEKGNKWYSQVGPNRFYYRGWKYVDKNWRYFTPKTGMMAKSTWVFTPINLGNGKTRKNWKYFNRYGNNIEKFYHENGNTHLSLVGPNRDYAKGWYKLGRVWTYYEGSWGKMVKKDWRFLNVRLSDGIVKKSWKYFNDKGYSVNSIYVEKGNRHYSQIGPNTYYHIGWRTIGSNRYYFTNPYGKAAVGRRMIGGRYYYFNSWGVLQ